MSSSASKAEAWLFRTDRLPKPKKYHSPEMMSLLLGAQSTYCTTESFTKDTAIQAGYQVGLAVTYYSSSLLFCYT